MPVSRTYHNGVWSATGVPPPTTPAPAPAVPAPTGFNYWGFDDGFDENTSIWKGEAGRKAYAYNKINDYFRNQTSGDALYEAFRKIYDANPMAGRAFRQAVMGSGHGGNWLNAIIADKMFGGDMNAYNNFANWAHHNSLEGAESGFDLFTGTYKPISPSYMPDGTLIKEFSFEGWDPLKYKRTGEWTPYTPTNNRPYTPEFSNYGVTYVPAGPNSSVKPNVAAVRGPGTPLANPNVPGYTPAAVGPGVTRGANASVAVTPPAAPNVPVPTPTSTPDPTPTNPYASGKPSAKSYQFGMGRWGRN